MDRNKLAWDKQSADQQYLWKSIRKIDHKFIESRMFFFINHRSNYSSVQFVQVRSLLDGQVEKVVMNTSAPEAYQGLPLSISFSGGNLENPAISPGDVDPFNYQLGILIMALITGAYVIIGGLKAVIITDVIQSVLLLLAGLLVAFSTFGQP